MSPPPIQAPRDPARPQGYQHRETLPVRRATSCRLVQANGLTREPW